MMNQVINNKILTQRIIGITDNRIDLGKKIFGIA